MNNKDNDISKLDSLKKERDEVKKTLDKFSGARSLVSEKKVEKPTSETKESKPRAKVTDLDLLIEKKLKEKTEKKSAEKPEEKEITENGKVIRKPSDLIDKKKSFEEIFGVNIVKVPLKNSGKNAPELEIKPKKPRNIVEKEPVFKAPEKEKTVIDSVKEKVKETVSEKLDKIPTINTTVKKVEVKEEPVVVATKEEEPFAENIADESFEDFYKKFQQSKKREQEEFNKVASKSGKLDKAEKQDKPDKEEKKEKEDKKEKPEEIKIDAEEKIEIATEKATAGDVSVKKSSAKENKQQEKPETNLIESEAKPEKAEPDEEKTHSVKVESAEQVPDNKVKIGKTIVDKEIVNYAKHSKRIEVKDRGKIFKVLNNLVFCFAIPFMILWVFMTYCGVCTSRTGFISFGNAVYYQIQNECGITGVSSGDYVKISNVEFSSIKAGDKIAIVKNVNDKNTIYIVKVANTEGMALSQSANSVYVVTDENVEELVNKYAISTTPNTNAQIDKSDFVGKFEGNSVFAGVLVNISTNILCLVFLVFVPATIIIVFQGINLADTIKLYKKHKQVEKNAKDKQKKKLEKEKKEEPVER